MRYGVTIPNVGMFGDAAVLADLAGRAEGAGWDGCFFWDHLLYHDQDWPVVDPWVAVSVATVRTGRIRLGVLCAAIPRYRPWRLAKTVATLDQLSDGRMVFGAALGSIPDEYSAYGESGDARVRADRADEGLCIIEQCWSGEAFQHKGEHYQVDSPPLTPRPLQTPRVPIWVGGKWPAKRPLRRAARWDGVMPIHADYAHGHNIPADELQPIVEYTTAQRESDEAFDVIVEVESSDSGDRGSKLAEAYRTIGVTWWVEKLGWWRGDLDAAIRRVEAGPPA